MPLAYARPIVDHARPCNRCHGPLPAIPRALPAAIEHSAIYLWQYMADCDDCALPRIRLDMEHQIALAQSRIDDLQQGIQLVGESDPNAVDQATSLIAETEVEMEGYQQMLREMP
jgi:hypothetical protein